MKLIYRNVGSMRHRTTIVMHLIIHICNSYRHCRILSVTKKLGDIWTDMLEIMKNEKYFENWCLFDYKFMANVPYASCVSGVGSTAAEMEDLTCFIILYN